MAQQTINIGASPNDGTGTPLRTAFQYTNSNFSELYTAVGPSGNNIVVPGNATITGAANFNGGALAAYLNGSLLIGSSGNYVNIYGQSNGLIVKDSTGVQNLFSIATAGVFTFGDGAGGTRMTLNATGLGVGMSPSASLSVLKSSATQATGLILRNANGTDGSSISLDFETSAGTSGSETSLAGRISGRRTGSGTTGALDFFVNNLGTLGSAKMTIDSSGNVGIGVTPSAGAGLLQFPSGNLIGNQSDNFGLSSNAKYVGGYKYVTGGKAALLYLQENGIHSWHNSAVGANANDPLTFTQAMTLDASGRLILLASTTTPATLATNGQLTFTATSNTNLRFSYRGSDGVTRVANITLA